RKWPDLPASRSRQTKGPNKGVGSLFSRKKTPHPFVWPLCLPLFRGRTRAGPVAHPPAYFWTTVVVVSATTWSPFFVTVTSLTMPPGTSAAIQRLRIITSPSGVIRVVSYHSHL